MVAGVDPLVSLQVDDLRTAPARELPATTVLPVETPRAVYLRNAIDAMQRVTAPEELKAPLAPREERVIITEPFWRHPVYEYPQPILDVSADVHQIAALKQELSTLRHDIDRRDVQMLTSQVVAAQRQIAREAERDRAAASHHRYASCVNESHHLLRFRPF